MSVVYLAIDLLHQTKHAVKIILPEFIGDDRKSAERFISEATAPSALSHPNIIKITDSGLLTGSLPFLVMDFIKGSSLHTVLSNGPLAPVLALEYVATIGTALDAVHQRQIIHGDLKPRSILIEDDRPIPDAIRITDFGVATIKSGKLQRSVAAKGTGVLRSPLYLAPEEFSEDASDYRSDIYSLGVILYEMLAGDVPFRGKSIPSIMKRHLLETPAPIAGRFPGVTPEIERVVMHALEKDPMRRPNSMTEFVEELDHATAVDLDQTIVLRKELPRASEDDFNATIVPGMMKVEMVEDSAVTEAAVDDQIKLAWEESPEPGDEVLEDDPVQSSVSPMLLAAGVLGFILLIALGIYYSRSIQP